MNAAALIKEARERSGLTQRLLARRAGTSHSTLAAYESGAKMPSLPTLVRVLRAAGFDLAHELVPTGPFENRRGRGAELLAVLELAELFPAKHAPELEYPQLHKEAI